MIIDYRKGELGNTFAELRFKSITEFSALRYRIAESLEARFPQLTWNAEQQTLRLESQAGSFMELTEARAVIQAEPEGVGFQAFKAQFQDCIAVLGDIAGVTELERAGIRTHVAFQVSRPDEAVGFIRDTLLKPRRQQFKVWGNGPSRVEVVFGMQDGDTQYTIRIAPSLLVRGRLQMGEDTATQEILEQRFAIVADIDTFTVSSSLAGLPLLADHVEVAVRDKLPAFIRELGEAG